MDSKKKISAASAAHVTPVVSKGTERLTSERLTSEKVLDALGDKTEVKNYKVMCELLGQPETAGNTKRAQTKDWLRFFDYEKKGQKYIINEVYDSPLPKPARKNDLYASMVESTLAAMLAQQPGYCCHLTKQQLFKKLYMVNERYGTWRDQAGKKYGNEPIECQSTIPVEENYILNAHEVDRFYCDAGLFLNDVLDRALRSLQNYRGMIRYSAHTVIVSTEMIDGQEVKQKRTATTDEEKIVLGVRQEVMHQMGMLNIPAIYVSGNGKRFFNKVNAILHERCGWDYTYEEYEIIYDEAHMKRRLPEVQKSTEELVRLFGVPLNKAIANGMNNAILTRRQKTGKKKYAFETEDGEKISFSTGPNPMFDAERTQAYARQKLLTELMVRISPESYDETYKTTVCLDTSNSTQIEIY